MDLRDISSRRNCGACIPTKKSNEGSRYPRGGFWAPCAGWNRTDGQRRLAALSEAGVEVIVLQRARETATEQHSLREELVVA
jgi:hypothetical protein